LTQDSHDTTRPLNYADPSVPPPAPSLGTQAARGAVWAAAPAVLAKLVGFAADIVLAWFLTRNDFGAVGLAIAVAAFFATIQQAGLRDILTHRQKRFARWATPAFWLAVALGLICTVLMAASAPLAARVFDSPILKGLIPLLSVRCLLDALAIVPQAKLQVELRFRSIGGVAAITTLLQAGLSVQLATPSACRWC
jgi:O-antigen/teichoic acid export membrane protein